MAFARGIVHTQCSRRRRITISSKKMYLDRFKGWNIQKNVKAQEKLAILRYVESRKANGKTSVIRVRGHRVSLKNIHRCHKKLEQMETLLHARQRLPTPLNTDIYTPPPSPIMTGPIYLETLELFLKSNEQYIKGSIESGIWVVHKWSVVTSLATKSILRENLTAQLFNNFNAGLTMLRPSDNRSFRILLNEATLLWEKILSLNDPESCLILLQIVKNASNFGQVEAAQSFLRCLAQFDLANPYLQHPLLRSLNQLSLLLSETDSTQLRHALLRAEQSNVEIWTEILGSSHWMAIVYKVSHICYYGDTGCQDQDLNTLQNIIRDCSESYIAGDWRLLWLHYQYALFLKNLAQKYAEAMQVYNHVVACCQGTCDLDELTTLGESHRGKALCYIKFGDISMAEVEYRQAIRIYEQTWGNGDAVVLGWRAELEAMFLEHEFHDAAAGARKERLKIMGTLYGETEVGVFG